MLKGGLKLCVEMHNANKSPSTQSTRERQKEARERERDRERRRKVKDRRKVKAGSSWTDTVSLSCMIFIITHIYYALPGEQIK